jgi:hypothetical protein
MALNNIIITKVDGGLGRTLPLTDMISGLIANGVAVGGGLQLGTTYKLQRIDDAIALGITAAYDTANDVLLYEHIKEFFRINSNGILWLLVVAKTVTFADMVDKSIATNAKKLLIDANGDINQLGVAFNPAVASASDVELLAAIPKAQLLAVEEYELHRPVHIVLEGKGFDSTSVTNLHTLNVPNVSVMVGQSKAVAGTSAHTTRYGAVGTLLGAISLASVNENIGWVRKFPLLGDNLQDFSIMNVDSLTITESLKNDLNDKGYIFFNRPARKTNIYFNDSHTGAELTSDFLYIENNRTINKATRIIYDALIDDLNSPINVDPTTGFIPAEVVKAMETLGNKAINDLMLKQGELSGFTFTINEEQNILSTSELETELTLTPTGTARTITVKIGFNNPFNS